MNKLSFSNLSIEITRRCNLRCDHCMRGLPEPIDIDKKHLKSLFHKIKSIGLLTITGGEPSLAMYRIDYIIKLAKNSGVEIKDFYIATNASFKCYKIIRSCFDLYLYCSDKKESKLQYSNDLFHKLGKDQVELLSCLTFVSPRYHEANHYTLEGGNTHLFKQGLCKTGREVTEMPFIVQDNNVVAGNDIYLNAKGEIINGCNWSYENQPEHKICNVCEMSPDKFKKYIADKMKKHEGDTSMSINFVNIYGKK